MGARLHTFAHSCTLLHLHLHQFIAGNGLSKPPRSLDCVSSRIHPLDTSSACALCACALPGRPIFVLLSAICCSQFCTELHPIGPIRLTFGRLQAGSPLGRCAESPERGPRAPLRINGAGRALLMRN